MSNFVEGADLSSHDGNVDLAQAKAAGLALVIVKTSQGTTYVNPARAQQIAQARANGMLVGHYAMYDLDVKNPVAQADHFCDTVGALGAGDIGMFVDLEAPGDMGSTRAIDPPKFVQEYHDFINRIEQRTGRTVIIYTYDYYWEKELGNPTDFAKTNPLWIAAYKVTSPPQHLFGGWTKALFHQYDDHGRVPGIKGGTGDVDRDYFLGTMEQLQSLAGIQPHVDQNRFFPQTQHFLSHGFLDYWNANGGLPMFGYPITEEIQEKLDDGNTYTVQYFERARFEYHPELVPPQTLLGQVGREAAKARGVSV